MGECAFALPPTTERASVMHMDWTTLVLLILNTAISFITNLDVNRKRNQKRSDD
nr:MAG: hypothetical protein [Microvirus sp.]